MLTRRQQEIWEVIQHLYCQNGYQPTLDEIGQQAGINARSTVHQHIQTLIREGYLNPAEGKKAYRLPKAVEDSHPQMYLALTGLPLQGRIAAGRPIEAIPDTTEVNPNEFFIGADRYALEVQGESMIDIGIMDGDYVVVQRSEEANNNDIVVALIEREEATLKRIFYLPDGCVELRPENKTMQSLFYPAESVQIQGRMIGLFRRM